MCMCFNMRVMISRNAPLHCSSENILFTEEQCEVCSRTRYHDITRNLVKARLMRNLLKNYNRWGDRTRFQRHSRSCCAMKRTRSRISFYFRLMPCDEALKVSRKWLRQLSHEWLSIPIESQQPIASSMNLIIDYARRSFYPGKGKVPAPIAEAISLCSPIVTA